MKFQLGDEAHCVRLQKWGYYPCHVGAANIHPLNSPAPELPWLAPTTTLPVLAQARFIEIRHIQLLVIWSAFPGEGVCGELAHKGIAGQHVLAQSCYLRNGTCSTGIAAAHLGPFFCDLMTLICSFQVLDGCFYYYYRVQQLAGETIGLNNMDLWIELSHGVGISTANC